MIWEMTTVKVIGGDRTEGDTKKLYLGGLREETTAVPNIARLWK